MFTSNKELASYQLTWVQMSSKDESSAALAPFMPLVSPPPSCCRACPLPCCSSRDKYGGGWLKAVQLSRVRDPRIETFRYGWTSWNAATRARLMRELF